MKRAIILFLAVTIQLTATAQSTNKSAHLATKEETLGKLLPGADSNTLTVDANFQHVAYVVKRGEKELAVMDGVEEKEYDKVAVKNEMYFSPDGKRLAYVAKRGDKKLVVVDGKEGKEYDDIYDLFNPIFSPDSQHLVYVALMANPMAFGLPPVKKIVVVDRKEEKKYDTVHTPIFSRDSKRMAYSVEKNWNRGMCVVVDGIQGKTYDQITTEAFSPDGSRFAYLVYERVDRSPGSLGNNFAVIDGAEKKKYFQDTAVSPVSFSPDSKHTAYTISGLENKVIRDDVAGKNYKRISGGVCFSPDSKRLAFTALDGDKWKLFVDEKPGYDYGVNEYTVPVFCPDGRLAYVAKIGTNSSVVVAGIAGKPLEAILTELTFNADGKHLAYAGQRGEKSIPILDGFEGKAYDKFLTCEPFLNTMGVDGPSNVGFAFDSRNVLHALALRGNELFRLEFQIVEE